MKSFEGYTITIVTVTLPKTNSSPLKIGLLPRKETIRIPTIPFQVQTRCQFQGGYQLVEGPVWPPVQTVQDTWPLNSSARSWRTGLSWLCDMTPEEMIEKEQIL